jgi:hypothetical protein
MALVFRSSRVMTHIINIRRGYFLVIYDEAITYAWSVPGVALQLLLYFPKIQRS